MFRPVGELAGRVRDGELGARKLVEAALERIEALDGEINAFTCVDAGGALAAAEAVRPGDERPLAGVPVAIKDNRAAAGLPLTHGSGALSGSRASNDSSAVRRLREAGAIVVGKTAMPEFGILPVCEPRAHGPTRNPWDPTRTPGGSSGGSAAAVAAGMVPFAHGNDGGGSLRIPGACCGLVALKPTRGRVSFAPERGESFLVSDGVLTRTTAESAMLLDLLRGPEPGDTSWAPPPARAYAAAAADPPADLRIGMTTVSALEDVRPDPLTVAGVHRAGELLRRLGHAVEEIEPPWAIPGLLARFAGVFGPAVATGMAAAEAHLGRELEERDVEPLSWMIWRRAKAQDAVAYEMSLACLEALGRRIVTALAPYDAVLTPVLAARPVAIGAIDACGADPRAEFAKSGRFTPYTALANVSGQPAISVPLYQGEDGLPLAVQLIGRPADEDTLIALAAQLESAEPWAARRFDLAAT